VEAIALRLYYVLIRSSPPCMHKDHTTQTKTSPTSFLPRTGILLSVDNYYNLQLADTEEWIDGAMAGNLGEVLIR